MRLSEGEKSGVFVVELLQFVQMKWDTGILYG
jgi:hypothetical protein